MTRQTINLLEYLGATAPDVLAASPALILNDDGTMTHWSEAKYAEMSPEDIPAGMFGTARKRYDMAKQSLALSEVCRVQSHVEWRKARKHSRQRAAVTEMRFLDQNENVLLGMSNAWLLVPTLRVYLAKHLPPHVESDYDATRNWMLLPDYIPDVDATLGAFYSYCLTTQPSGSIHWRENGSGRASIVLDSHEHPQKFRLSAAGRLASL